MGALQAWIASGVTGAERLGYELWNRLDAKAHIRVQSYSAVVYLNGHYHGLYTITDHVDGYVMEDFGYDQQGNLYKARSYDGNFRDTSEDWWIWVSFIDAAHSAGKNSYSYHDQLRADALWHCVPWDLNASFGQDWKTQRSPANGAPPNAWSAAESDQTAACCDGIASSKPAFFQPWVPPLRL